MNVSDGTYNINAKNGDKLFLWDNTNTMKPLSGNIIVGEKNQGENLEEDTQGKILVVYFSAQSHTERVANYIAQETGADIFELVKPYLWCANLGQVFYFIANTLTVILLRFTEEKYQLVINILFLIVFVVIAIPMTIALGLWGMAIALVVVNLIKILIIMAVGCAKI